MQTVDFSDLTDADVSLMKEVDVINPMLRAGEIGTARRRHLTQPLLDVVDGSDDALKPSYVRPSGQ
jgi:hypothetical protein